MPEYSVEKYQTKRISTHEIRCKQLPEDDPDKFEEANYAGIRANYDINQARKAGQFDDEVEKRKRENLEKAVKTLSDFVPKEKAQELVDAAYDGKEGVSVRF